MILKSKLFLNIFNIKTLIFLLSILILKANAEIKIIANSDDTLLKLSKQYEVPLKELMHKNNINDANKNLDGRSIIIPVKQKTQSNSFTYKVLEGDTIYKIARDHEVTPTDIILLNSLVLKPHCFNALKNSDCFLKLMFSKCP